MSQLVYPPLVGKFPFWSAIITQNSGSVSVPAAAWGSVVIQPPAGETWFIFIDTAVDVAYQYIVYISQFDGASERIHGGSVSNPSYGSVNTVSTAKILTNTLYAKISSWNNDTSAHYLRYGYSGFKLSQPHWSPKRLNNDLDPPPWKRKTQFEIPKTPDLSPLAKYIWDVYDHTIGDYRQAIILEEDTPLAVDERGFTVERYTAIVYVDDFIKNLAAFKADPMKTGYKKYFDKWLAEGIKI